MQHPTCYPDAPAAPIDIHYGEDRRETHYGLTVREEFAARNMAGMPTGMKNEHAAELSVRRADALIAALNTPPAAPGEVE